MSRFIYRTLSGLAIDYSDVAGLVGALEAMAESEGMGWAAFEARVNELRKNELWAGRGLSIVGSTLYTIVQDMALRRGVQEGRVAKPTVADLLHEALTEVRVGRLDLGPQAEDYLTRFIQIIQKGE